MAKVKRKGTASEAAPGPPPETQGTRVIAEGRKRAVIDALLPVVDGGRFPAKRIAGESVEIEAHCFADGHDKLRVVLRWQRVGASDEYEVDMKPRANDVWLASFTPPQAGGYRYTVVAWVDHFESWRAELERRQDQADIRMALRVGSALIDEAATRAQGSDRSILTEWSAQLRTIADDAAADPAAQKAMALDSARAAIVARYADRSFAATQALELVADRKRAAFSAWYELFPRSAGVQAGQHGTFRDVEDRLNYLAEMGFDVLYFPPIHPIGRINRKGANNALSAKPEDVGSPWAIGAAEGGHKDILPQLGTLEDFRRLLTNARELGIEIALDIAFQVAPDHPYVKAHPQWFKHRPDGSVQYAENPPKKYQDIYPFDFETDDWRALWGELKSIVDFWIAQGVRIFRVDNPHTKAFGFWEWMINAVKRDEPDVIFLAEAFTRPKLMHRLAKLGFSQSYTYFTWRNSKQELTDYFTDLALGPGREYFRPNVWPNTPDILHETLQSGLRPVFAARLILAATLAANYGIYGPTYELLESTPREPGSEEYRDSEKYQLRHWPAESSDSLWSLIARINGIRKENAALQSDRSLRFCPIDNDQLIAYLKIDAVSGNVILTVVNLDPHQPHSGWVDLDVNALKLDAEQPYQVHDLLSDQRYIWRGRYNYVMLDPRRAPAHVFRLRRRVRSEQDFDYYL
ncbi:MAG TPA: alpha-1,4-glucan--maltose-1-phosphate maltosyltransferase [Steroidobacteraceae bacterium]|jgi:starch synthase (maltosyl-transferring)|nr:alpha-1,4-glucan--maltose-1-phosphate maltosyltransferase [Steroidobacteraceae bacterium]